MIGALAVWMLAAAAPAFSADAVDVDVIMFPLAPALPLYVALDKGFFRAEGLEVRLTPTPDSVYLVDNLASGRFQVAFASIDNFIAYQEGQHDGKTLLGRDLFAFMGVSRINLHLVVRAGIDSYAGLRGRDLGVDKPTTGFAFVMLKMLERGGLGPDDYRLVEAGATVARGPALMRGEIDATLLSPGLANQANRAGFPTLEQSRDVVGDIQGTVLAAERTWAAANGETLTAFTRAVLRAIDFIFEPANGAEAAAILAANMGMPEGPAKGAVRGLTRGGSLARDGAPDMAGVERVLKLRSEYGRPQKTLTDPAKYFDLGYLEAARR